MSPTSNHNIHTKKHINYSSPTSKWTYSQELFYKHLYNPDLQDLLYNKHSEINITSHQLDIKLKDLHPPRDLELTYIPPHHYLRSRELHHTPLTYTNYARRVQTYTSSACNITNGWERYPNAPHLDFDKETTPNLDLLELYANRQYQLIDNMHRYNTYLQKHSTFYKTTYPSYPTSPTTPPPYKITNAPDTYLLNNNSP